MHRDVVPEIPLGGNAGLRNNCFDWPQLSESWSGSDLAPTGALFFRLCFMGCSAVLRARRAPVVLIRALAVTCNVVVNCNGVSSVY